MPVTELAEVLASGRYRFLTDMQIGTLRRLYGASRDDVRKAAILADRIRRQRQVDEGSNTFRVCGLVPVEAPIVLPVEVKGKRRRLPA